MSFQKAFIALFTLLLTSSTFASDEHGIGKIVTDELNLSYIDHVLTGRIGDRPVFAKPLAEGFGLALWHRAHGQDFETVFTKVDKELKGPVQSLSATKEAISTVFQVTGLSGKEGRLEGIIGDRKFTVQVTADEMNGHHYINPHFEITFADGFIYEFDIEDGQACMGCAVKLSYAIISMLHAYGTI